MAAFGMGRSTQACTDKLGDVPSLFAPSMAGLRDAWANLLGSVAAPITGAKAGYTSSLSIWLYTTNPTAGRRLLGAEGGGALDIDAASAWAAQA